MRVSILGCGYVGPVTGACLAEIGHEVVCAGNDPGKIHTLKQGALPIYEPNLDDIVARNTRAQRLRFSGDLREAIRFGGAILICVGTPPLENGDADLSAIDKPSSDWGKWRVWTYIC